MKPNILSAISIGLVCSASSLVLAQPTEPPKLIRIIREDIKSGKGAAHEKTEMAYVRAFSKTKYANYLAMESLTGATQAWFLEVYDSYAALENSLKISDAQPLKAELDALDAQDGELRTGERGMIAAFQPALSYAPGPVDASKFRYFQVNTLRIRFGHQEDFAERMKLLTGAFQKSKSPQPVAVYAVTSGAPAGTYLLIRGMSSLKALDPDPSRMSNADALGSDNQRYVKLNQDVIVSNESTLFSINPRMSNPPKAFITSDPGFWAPKPKPASAKPTNGQ
jgi:hypothetical protein